MHSNLEFSYRFHITWVIPFLWWVGAVNITHPLLTCRNEGFFSEVFWLASRWAMKWCSPPQTQSSVLCLGDLTPTWVPLPWPCPMCGHRLELSLTRITTKATECWVSTLRSLCSPGLPVWLHHPDVSQLDRVYSFSDEMHFILRVTCCCEFYLGPVALAISRPPVHLQDHLLPGVAKRTDKDLNWCRPALEVDSQQPGELADTGINWISFSFPCKYFLAFYLFSSVPGHLFPVLGIWVCPHWWGQCVLALLFSLMNRASEKLFWESMNLLETVISSLVRLWTLLSNVHFDFNSILDITSKMKNDVLIHNHFWLGSKRSS